MEGVGEDVTFPWSGASSVTMGLAAGMGRTLHATFDRAVFPDQRPFAVKGKDGQSKDKRNKLESAVNWLATEENNLVDTLRDTPLPAFRDGTVPVMGEWERRIEKACDYRTYQTKESFQKDYPSPEDAGMEPDEYLDLLSYLDKRDAKVSVEFIYDEVVYNAPRFTMFPLARLVWYPLSIEKLDQAILYGRQFFESEADAKAKIKRKEYDKEAAEAAVKGIRGAEDDAWGRSRDGIEGLSRSDDDFGRLETYRLVLIKDLDDDDIPEKYMLTFDFGSKRILKMERYRLRKNINNVVLFRLIKRDGRLLGVSMVDDGFDQFEMVDSIHRHRQNTRAITDCPAFLVPEGIKEEVDFGSGPSVFYPGITFYLNDRYMKEDMAPRQLIVQNLSKTSDSLDEEKGVIRYLEFRLGPSQGLSGQESSVDPSAPATKTIAQLKQASFRLDDCIREWKRSVPDVIDLHNALYYMYGEDKMIFGTQDDEAGEPQFDAIERELFALDKTGFVCKHNEISLSPEYEMEKVMGLASIAAQNPILLQVKPQILLELWNDLVLAARAADPQRLIVPVPQVGQQPQPGGGEPGPFGAAAEPGQPGQPGQQPGGAPTNPDALRIMQILRQGNIPAGPDLGAPTPNQHGAAAMARFLPGAPGGVNGTR